MLAFKGSIWPLTIAGYTVPGYAAFYTVILNIVIAVALTIVFKIASKTRHADVTVASDYA